MGRDSVSDGVGRDRVGDKDWARVDVKDAVGVTFGGGVLSREMVMFDSVCVQCSVGDGVGAGVMVSVLVGRNVFVAVSDLDGLGVGGGVMVGVRLALPESVRSSDPVTFVIDGDTDPLGGSALFDSVKVLERVGLRVLSADTVMVSSVVFVSLPRVNVSVTLRSSDMVYVLLGKTV